MTAISDLHLGFKVNHSTAQGYFVFLEMIEEKGESSIVSSKVYKKILTMWIA